MSLVTNTWVVFDGTQTPPTVLSSGNVEHVERIGGEKGRYKIVFQTELPTPYIVQLSVSNDFGAIHGVPQKTFVETTHHTVAAGEKKNVDATVHLIVHTVSKVDPVSK